MVFMAASCPEDSSSLIREGAAGVWSELGIMEWIEDRFKCRRISVYSDLTRLNIDTESQITQTTHLARDLSCRLPYD